MQKQSITLHRVIGPFYDIFNRPLPAWHVIIEVLSTGELFHFVVYGETRDDAWDVIDGALGSGKALDDGRKVPTTDRAIWINALSRGQSRPQGTERVVIAYGVTPYDGEFRWFVTVTAEGGKPRSIKERRPRSYLTAATALRDAKLKAEEQGALFGTNWQVTITTSNGPSPTVT
ncbi:hypothetical protein HUE56_29705 (plasmid) [Azospirillum oryzae]|uniref:Uncharacterized protein n=1 Tax=Azospirillum oryzae TaxID=286727 RepID=A0A6N1ATI6_9PROT|nr:MULTISPECIES: hypothetical protein [Azospirillum]KAA0584747.1 hypothetical protein FZ938_28555 [Azospirillum oryzae]QCG99223.1 hypothetical protein E6C67_36155 [Azospirillum sp. TSA2s]QKS54679.1 hypothetical protein HUE56_29705 [Azospirillum oryzae]GLR77569.1 hypothetical protein GCM10007856_02370 [Azospirillum oryzae]